MNSERVNIHPFSPLYIVLFSADDLIDSDADVFLSHQYEETASITVPHGLSVDLSTALPALWYCLHLPNTFSTLADLPFPAFHVSRELHLDHQIWFAPTVAFDEAWFGRARDYAIPVLIICPDQELEEVQSRASALGLDISILTFSDLTNQNLARMWKKIHNDFGHEIEYLGREIELTNRLDTAGTTLPYQWLARQMGAQRRIEPETDIHEAIHELLYMHLVLSALSNLERQGLGTEEANAAMPATLMSEHRSMKVPFVLGWPGVPAAYARRAYSPALRRRIKSFPATDSDDTWGLDMATRRDDLVERSAIEFLVTHRAIARNGIGIVLPSVPQEAFTILAQLERHWIDNPDGPTVWKFLKRLNAATASIWTEALQTAIMRASMLTTFSNFPIGLLTMPGDSSPVSTRATIAYRPVLPLGRAIQNELQYVPGYNMSTTVRVVVLECIPRDDVVGQMSRVAWQDAKENLMSGQQNLQLDLVEIENTAEFRSAVDRTRPDVLIVSAHGYYDPASNVAGLVVGNELALGPGLGPLPPVVILSACHVTPKGAGAVNVADMLIREGARAILGTLVPVDVTHNSVITTRLLIYIAESLANREPHTTLLDAWKHVQSSNAINDIVNSGSRLREWLLSREAGEPSVLEEFMLSRSMGRLRAGSIYEDTEQILVEMADERGMGAKVRQWLRKPGYLPESLFYIFSGSPERIYIDSGWIGISSLAEDAPDLRPEK
ncbi:hypothetical protein [Amycolatopsis solani]|uniref:hypothetical protein n=1 Tax=Amycolatopsis solani TaxID=3028615 RepID=UPI0025B2158D|nr:hypothetical protein [Amycolatopsis sp. MEP2-6]